MWAPRSRSSFVSLLLAISTILVLLEAVSAQSLQQCDVNSVTGYKVLLDDIRFNSGASDDANRKLMDLLNFQLRNRLDTTDTSPVAIRYKLIRCNGRAPAGENSFPPLIVEGLVNRDVVLEVWGEVFPPIAGKHRVFLNYALLPMPVSTVSPFLSRQYEPKVGSSADELVDWLANLNELTSYAMAARAVRLVNNQGAKAYDTAKADLDTSIVSLKRAFGKTPTPQQAELLAFLTTRKCSILRDAKSNADYKGPLRLVPAAVVERECPAGGTR